ncbi:MAG: hypothetical protein ACRC5M_00660 [Anaeroplasmataceae bacterium]
MKNNDILFKPNGLILATANKTITASEYKVFDTLLQRCQITKDMSPWRKAEISREEMKTLINDNNKATLEHLKLTLDAFQSIKIKFKLGKQQVNGVLIAEYVYDEVEDIFICSMSENVFTALMTYKEIGYSPIDLKLVREARGFYTQKIYGILRMWSKLNTTVSKTYTVQLIKDTCDIFEGTSYDEYKVFKRRVLVPALKEINEKLNMKVEYKEIKLMRKVQQIEFIFLDYESKKYDFKKEMLVAPKDLILIEDPSNKIDIDSIDYMNMVDCKINESIHTVFLQDFEDYKDYISSVQTASNKTLDTIGGKTINKRNYKYFKTSLENLVIEIK